MAWRSILSAFLFLLALSPSAFADSYSFNTQYSLSPGAWKVSVHSSGSLVASGSNPSGWSLVGSPANPPPQSPGVTTAGSYSYSIVFPATLTSSVTYDLNDTTTNGIVPFDGTSFSAGSSSSSSSAPCLSAYPSTVSMYLADAPSPCQYFAATQGFNKSSAPLLLAVLGVLAVILAIWLGHDSIMSLFRRLLTGMTGGH